MNDVPLADPVAAEIHRNFNRKMRAGGHIDRILNGGEPMEIQQPLPDAELAVMKRSIEIQLNEYETAISAAKSWIRSWFDARRPKGFRKTLR